MQEAAIAAARKEIARLRDEEASALARAGLGGRSKGEVARSPLGRAAAPASPAALSSTPSPSPPRRHIPSPSPPTAAVAVARTPARVRRHVEGDEDEGESSDGDWVPGGSDGDEDEDEDASGGEGGAGMRDLNRFRDLNLAGAVVATPVAAPGRSVPRRRAAVARTPVVDVSTSESEPWSESESGSGSNGDEAEWSPPKRGVGVLKGGRFGVTATPRNDTAGTPSARRPKGVLESPSPPPAPRSAGPAAPGSLTRRKSAAPHVLAGFLRSKDARCRELFLHYNAAVFGGALPRDLDITWSNRLNTTAGLSHFRRQGDVHSARVELSSKVVDSDGRLRKTLLHELCHVAAWLVDRVAKPPHGPVFKKWADLAERVTGVEVQTCHTYEIAFKFRYKCGNAWCGKEYGRHSRSIDPKTQACGVCGGRLSLLGSFKADGTPARQQAPNAFSLFVRDNMAAARAGLPRGASQKEVMARLSELWRREKAKEQLQQQSPPPRSMPAAIDLLL